MTNVEQFKRENWQPNLCIKSCTKHKYVTQQQQTTTDLLDPDLKQRNTEIAVYVGVKYISGCQSLLLAWDCSAKQ